MSAMITAMMPAMMPAMITAMVPAMVLCEVMPVVTAQIWHICHSTRGRPDYRSLAGLHISY